MATSPISNKSQTALNDWNLQHLLWTAIAYWRIIALVTFVFSLVGLRFCLKAQPIYEAATTVRMPSSGSVGSGTPYLQSGDQVETLVEICESENVAARVFDELNLDKRPEFHYLTPTSRLRSLLGQVSVTNIIKSNILSIRAESTNPQFAADLANTWAKCFVEVDLELQRQAVTARREFLEQQVANLRDKLANPDLKLNDESKSDQTVYDQLLESLRQARIAENNESLGMVILDKALPADGPVRPNKRKIMKMALFLGLLAGFQLALFLEWLLDKVRTLDRLKHVTGLPNYALLPDFRRDYPGGSGAAGGVNGVRSLVNDSAFESSTYRESFRVFRTNLSYAQSDKPLETVSVLSPGYGEGKTLVNANLALSLAQVGKKVLLVDADFRKPGLFSLFGIQIAENKGLPAALAGQSGWKTMVVSSGVGGLDLLPNRVVVPNSTELLSGDSMKRFVAEVKAQYDFVVFDGPPILQTIDSRVLATLLDGVVLLVGWNKTRLTEVKKAMEELASVKAQVVGTILNRVDPQKGYFGAEVLSEYGYNIPAGKEAGLKKVLLRVKKKMEIFNWLLP